jgi:methylmalonyl-CoA mutase cobalamin-binding domain/chain
MPGMETKEMNKARHPIGVVSRRTGITQDVLRAWERRYEAVVPYRAPTGRRLYSDLDIERLRLLRRLVDGGRRISDVATLSRTDLEALVREDEGQALPADELAEGVHLPAQSPADYLQRCLRAIETLDRPGLERSLDEAAVSLSRARFRQEVVAPLLEAVGKRWQDGSMRVVHEHMATAIIRGYLGAMRNGETKPSAAPRLLVTTPAGQLHELGALLVTSAAVDGGWDVVYLGPNLPAEEIAAAAREKGARAVALSVIYPGHDPGVADELRRLRRFLEPDVVILVGGRAADSYADVIAEIGAVQLNDLIALQQALQSLAG